MKNLIISGYGRMGKEVEKIAIESGWNIMATVDNQIEWESKSEEIAQGNVIIDFSTPEVVLKNIEKAFDLNVPIVVGTTGWNIHLQHIKNQCIALNKSLVYASNFSIGVNIFFEINKQLAEMMNQQTDYEVSIEEIHHIKKLDSPSGTAISLAQQIIDKLDRKNGYINQPTFVNSNELSIISKRIANVPGTHSIVYQSAIDDIEIKHTAKSRTGFAKGAIWAAEWIIDKKGFYDFNDILFNKL